MSAVLTAKITRAAAGNGRCFSVIQNLEILQAQAALMYDAVFVLVEAFNKILRKKPDQFRNNIRRGQTAMAAASTSANTTGLTSNGMLGGGIGSNLMGGSSSGGNGNGIGGGNSGGVGGSNSNNNNAPRALDCNTSKGWVNPWEHGDKISRYLRKVSHNTATKTYAFCISSAFYRTCILTSNYYNVRVYEYMLVFWHVKR